MAEVAEKETTTDFEKRMAAERQFFLRKTDKDPNTNLPLKESQAAHAEIVTDFEEKNAKRAQNAQKAYDSKQAEAAKATTKRLSPDDPLPSRADLKKWDTEELIVLAADRNVDVKANVDTKDDIIDKLYGTYKEADVGETPKTTDKK